MYGKPTIKYMVRELRRYGAKTGAPCFIPTHLRILMRAAAAYIEDMEMEAMRPIQTTNMETQRFEISEIVGDDVVCAEWHEERLKNTFKRSIADWVLSHAETKKETRGHTTLLMISAEVAVKTREKVCMLNWNDNPVQAGPAIYLQNEVRECLPERCDTW